MSVASNWDTVEAYALLCASEELYWEATYYAHQVTHEFEPWVRRMFADGKQFDPERVDYNELLGDFLLEEN